MGVYPTVNTEEEEHDPSLITVRGVPQRLAQTLRMQPLPKHQRACFGICTIVLYSTVLYCILLYCPRMDTVRQRQWWRPHQRRKYFMSAAYAPSTGSASEIHTVDVPWSAQHTRRRTNCGCANAFLILFNRGAGLVDAVGGSRWRLAIVTCGKKPFARHHASSIGDDNGIQPDCGVRCK